jgi:hypothetical protein
MFPYFGTPRSDLHVLEVIVVAIGFVGVRRW